MLTYVRHFVSIRIRAHTSEMDILWLFLSENSTEVFGAAINVILLRVNWETVFLLLWMIFLCFLYGNESAVPFVPCVLEVWHIFLLSFC